MKENVDVEARKREDKRENKWWECLSGSREWERVDPYIFFAFFLDGKRKEVGMG